MSNKLTIYFTSDTHGYLYPTNFADTQIRPMGLLSMKFPKDGNTLVIDGGDTIQGSPLTYYCHSHHLPTPASGALNALGYDYVTLGNHDFNYGYDALNDYLHSLNARCLCANVEDRRGELPIQGCAVHVLANGLRVGLVGLVTDWVNLWEKPENLTEVTVTDPFVAAQKAVTALQADVLIGIYHGGVEKDLQSGQPLSDTTENIACRLCEKLPFDMLLTGHQHIAMANESWHGVHIVQPPCNAASYVKVVLDEQGVFHSELCPVKPITCFSAEETKQFADLNAWLDRPIGHLSRAIWPEDKVSMALHGSSIADFFNAVQLEASGADLSCTALGNEIRGFDSQVTVRDVVASYVYSNTLVVLEVTGAVLRQALEQCASYFAVADDGTVSVADPFLRPKEAHYNYDYFSGVNYSFDLCQPVGQRLCRMEKEGREIREDDCFTLCMSNYRATGAGDFDCYKACRRVREIQTEISELILQYLSNHPMVDIPAEHPYSVILPSGKQGRDHH